MKAPTNSRPLLERGRRTFRYIYLRLVRVGGDPVHAGLGFALGVFLGVFPTFGLGIPVALLIASVLHWNRAAAVLGSLVMNPLTTPFFWSLSATIGGALFRADAKNVLKSGAKLSSFTEGALIYLAGNTIVALVAAVAAYFVAVRAVRLYRRKKWRRLRLSARRRRLAARGTKRPYDPVADEVKADEREGHEHQVVDVRRRGEEGGQNDRAQQGVPPLPSEKPGAEPSGPGEQEGDEGRLERDPEGEKDRAAEGHELSR